MAKTTFEGLRIYKMQEMMPGELYMFYNDEYAPEGIIFCFEEIAGTDHGNVFVGLDLKNNYKVLLSENAEQKNLDDRQSALYLLSELKC